MPKKATTADLLFELTELRKDTNAGFQMVAETLGEKIDISNSHLEASASVFKTILEELAAHRAGLDRVEKRLHRIEQKLEMEPLQ